MAQLASKYMIVELVPEDIDAILDIEKVAFKSPWPKEVFEMEFQITHRV